MNPLEFISAGAGSGKTYRLTAILSETLAEGSARPAGVVAMTFTIKAAAELRQRARSALLERGRLDLSTAVGQARIGTVNAVCGQLLQRYCFELGLSPDQTVLTEAQSKLMLRRALDDVLDPTQREALIRYGERFDLDRGDWDKPVRNIVDAARANAIDAAALQQFGSANAASMLSNWPAAQVGVDLTAQLTAAISSARAQVESFVANLIAAGQEPQKNTLSALDELRAIGKCFDQGNWAWKQWVALAKLNGGVKLRATIEPVINAAAAHDRHPDFHADVQTYLQLVFELAASALASYEEAKRVAGALDFTDQEMLLLRALHTSQPVRARLAEELDLVLVDEFQDTSPIQLAVFVELAKLAKRSVWVGDPKQAIYGFRGTDAALIASVLEAIPGWGGSLGAPLTSSRRSVPSLVNLMNEVFTPAFPKLKAEAVHLTPVRTEHPDQPSLIHWKLGSNNVNGDFQALGPAISELLASGLQVQDTETEDWRAVAAGDIAVLCRYNYQIPIAASALQQWGVPCMSTRPGLLTTPEATLVLACLRRMFDPSDTVATALIVSLTDGRTAEGWLDDRLKYLQAGAAPAKWKSEGAEAHPLVARLEQLRGRLASLSPMESLGLAMAESCICRHAAQWSATPKDAATRVSNVEALMRMGCAYEDECRSSKRPATIAGLLQWLAEQAHLELDARAAASGGAVEVLTHHSAKGLEWPVVVLTGMDSVARSGLWDVRAHTSGAFDAQQPLRGRFIHYWPRPFGPRREPDVLKRAQASPRGVEMQSQEADERNRLLYVSCTRARDVLVFAVHARKSATAWTDDINATALLFGGEGDIKLAQGSKVRRSQRLFSEQDIAASAPGKESQERRWFTRTPLARIAPMWLRPSAAAEGHYRIGAVEAVGRRIPLNGNVDMTALGSAMHNALALLVGDDRQSVSEQEVSAIMARWSVAGAVDASAVLAQGSALREWVQRKWRAGRQYVEVPVEVALPSGQVVRGQIDLLVETKAGWILIDHKADPRGAGQDDRLARTHGPQLGVYADALAQATGQPVIERWLFLPIAGQATRLEASADAPAETGVPVYSAVRNIGDRWGVEE